MAGVATVSLAVKPRAVGASSSRWYLHDAPSGRPVRSGLSNATILLRKILARCSTDVVPIGKPFQNCGARTGGRECMRAAGRLLTRWFETSGHASCFGSSRPMTLLTRESLLAGLFGQFT